jgi:hypothetical protein
MAITHNYTLLCDDVRREDNGKFIILGLYTPDIVVPAVPFAVPSLCLFTVFDADESGQHGFSFKLKLGETIVAGGSGKLTGVSGSGALPIKFGGLQLAAGRYTFTLDIEGNQTIIHEFGVLLRVQTMSASTAAPSTSKH